MNSTRFEFQLPADRRRELDELAAETGLSVADLIRLATRRLVNDRATLLKSTAEAAR